MKECILEQGSLGPPSEVPAFVEVAGGSFVITVAPGRSRRQTMHFGSPGTNPQTKGEVGPGPRIIPLLQGLLSGAVTTCGFQVAGGQGSPDAQKPHNCQQRQHSRPAVLT